MLIMSIDDRQVGDRLPRVIRVGLVSAALAITAVTPGVPGPAGRSGAFDVPPGFWESSGVHPAAYISSLVIDSTDRQLHDEEREALADLFRAAYYACRFKYRQDYPVNTSARSYRLLKRQYPNLSNLERERGQVIFLGDIAEFVEGPGARVDSAPRSKTTRPRPRPLSAP